MESSFTPRRIAFYLCVLFASTFVVLANGLSDDAALQCCAADQTSEACCAGEPLVIINGEQSSQTVMNALSCDNIDKIDVFKGEAAVAKYGDKAKAGAIIVTLKKHHP